MSDDTSIAGVFLNSEEATRLFTAIKALDELVFLTVAMSLPPEFPGSTLELINRELQFVVLAEHGTVFEFETTDDDKLKHLAKQKARLEAAVKALKGVSAVH